MLANIHIRNLAIVDEIDIELNEGMTTLTGETGAGKSILVDALGLVLGDRADSSVIRHGSERAEITASFEITDKQDIRDWLRQHDMDSDDDCQLRRVVNRGGRSRGYINGQPATMNLLRELGERLVDIHGQHEHQSLLRPAVQRQLLDAFGGHRQVLQRVAALYGEWRAARDRLDTLDTDDAERSARQDLLRYQLQELETLAMTAADIDNVDSEHARLANAGHLISGCQQVLEQLDSETGQSAGALVGQAVSEVTGLASLDPALQESAALLNETAINIQECIAQLRRYSESLELDPQRLHWLEERISLLNDLARKHACQPVELPEIEERLRSELDTIEHADEHRAGLAARVAELEQEWNSAAQALTRRRNKAAHSFSNEISAAMQTLGMAGGSFEATVKPRRETAPGPTGMDEIIFQVSANPGQPRQPLAQVASGGELSRISLSIQVITADSETIPTLIFDEVDSGIGGGVAEIVGRKLRALATGRQVLCVTHLPQVAALAHHQLQVSKSSTADATRTRVTPLDEDARVDELARMLGGVKITRQTREHAREMMQLAGKQEKTPGRRRRKAGA